MCMCVCVYVCVCVCVYMCCMRKCKTSECHVCISIQFLPLRPPPTVPQHTTHKLGHKEVHKEEQVEPPSPSPLPLHLSALLSSSLCPSLYVSFSYHDVRFDTACPQGDTTEQSKQEQPLRPRLMYETRPRRHHAARGDGGDGGGAYVPLPQPDIEAGKEEEEKMAREATCIWDRPIEYALQESLMSTLKRLMEHFGAAVLRLVTNYVVYYFWYHW